MLFQIFKEDFFPQKKNDRLKFPASAIFSSPKGSLGWWRNNVARPGCLDAILVFLLKTASFASRPAQAIVMSLQPYQLEVEYSFSEEAKEDSEDSEKEEVSLCQSSSTEKGRMDSSWRVYKRCTVLSRESTCVLQRTPFFQSQWKVRYFAFHFSICLFRWGAIGTMKDHDA